MKRHLAETLARALRGFVDRLPPRLQWAPHNLVAHPLSEVLFQLGHGDLGNQLHDATVPEHLAGTGRG